MLRIANPYLFLLILLLNLVSAASSLRYSLTMCYELVDRFKSDRNLMKVLPRQRYAARLADNYGNLCVQIRQLEKRRRLGFINHPRVQAYVRLAFDRLESSKLDLLTLQEIKDGQQLDVETWKILDSFVDSVDGLEGKQYLEHWRNACSLRTH